MSALLSGLDGWFLSQEIRDNPDSLRRARMLIWLSIAVAGVMLAVELVRQWIEPHGGLGFAGWVLGLVLLLMGPWTLRFQGRLEVAGTLSMSGLIVAIVMNAIAEGGLHNPAVLALPAVPITASFFGGARSGIGIGALVFFTLVALWLAPAVGIVLPPMGIASGTLPLLQLAVLLAVTLGVVLHGVLYESGRRMSERMLDERALELSGARDQALVAAETKAVFLANMSHEIRTPLNAVVGMTELLANSEMTKSQQQALRVVKDSTHALLSTINDILDISKLEAGRLQLEVIAFDARDCLEDSIALLAHEAWKKKIQILGWIPHDVPAHLKGDPARLRQVLSNLLANAVKFTQTGQVVVRASLDADSRLHFIVSDTGIGVDPDRQGSLFEAFEQADASTTRRYGGTGLGLAICRHLTEMMGGRIWLESESGRGSDFHVTIAGIDDGAVSAPPSEPLPVRRALVCDPFGLRREMIEELSRGWGVACDLVGDVNQLSVYLRGEPAADCVLLSSEFSEADLVMRMLQSHDPRMPCLLMGSVSDATLYPRARELGCAAVLSEPVRRSRLRRVYQHITTDPDVLGSAISSAPHSVQFDSELAGRAPLKVLVAEDNLLNQQVICSVLQAFGYVPDVVSNGLEAVQHVRRRGYDVVFMDMQMPGLDGLEATRMIRSDGQVKVQPQIIALTANVLPEQREQCRLAGMDAFVGKPIDVSHLVTVLHDCFEASGSGPGRFAQTEPPADVAATGSEVVLDPVTTGMLEDLAASQPAGFLSQLVDEYDRDAKMLLERIAATAAQGEAADLKVAAHTLKGSSRSIGAEAVAQCALEVEQCAAQEDLAGARLLLERLEREYLRAHEALSARKLSRP